MADSRLLNLSSHSITQMILRANNIPQEVPSPPFSEANVEIKCDVDSRYIAIDHLRESLMQQMQFVDTLLQKYLLPLSSQIFDLLSQVDLANKCFLSSMDRIIKNFVIVKSDMYAELKRSYEIPVLVNFTTTELSAHLQTVNLFKSKMHSRVDALFGRISKLKKDDFFKIILESEGKLSAIVEKFNDPVKQLLALSEAPKQNSY